MRSLGLNGRSALRLTIAIAATAAFLALAAGVASAATFTVNDATDAALTTPSDTTCSSTNGGSCTLRAAVQAADNTGGANAIAVPAGTYKLTIGSTGAADPTTGDLDVTTGSLTLTGAGASTTVIDANHLDRAFAVDQNASLSISGVTITNGDAEVNPNSTNANSTAPKSGGAIYTDGTLSVDSSILTSNQAADDGGGIYVGSDATSTTVTNSTISFADATFDPGGAIDLTGGTLNISGSTFSHDATNDDNGGALLLNGGDVAISGSTFDSNTARADESGGAIYDESASNLTITGSTFTNNSAADQGGAIYHDGSGGALVVSGSNFTADSAGDGAGAIYQGDGTLTASGTTFDANTAGDGDGGALLLDSTGASQISTSTFSDNTADGDTNDGGGIYADAGDVTVSQSNFFENFADQGGGLYYDANTLTVTNSTFDSNQANTGGGLYLSATAATLTSDTITRNGAQFENLSSGGGIFHPGFADNGIQDTIVAGNYGQDCDSGAGASNTGFNIDSDGTCFTPPTTGDQTVPTALLGPNANNGGPTFTDALLPGSPAIDGGGGSCPGVDAGVDQRGVARPQGGGCDVGAFEAAAADLALSKSGPATATVGAPITYAMTVTDSGPAPGTGLTLTDALPAGTVLFAVTPSQGSCSGATTVVCALGTIDVGASATVSLTLIANSAGAITNHASVSGNEPDPNTANNSASASTVVSAPAGTSTSTVVNVLNQPGRKPSVTTGQASEVTKSSVLVSGIVNPLGFATSYHFAIGGTPALGPQSRTMSAGAGIMPLGVRARFTHLKAGRTYYFRLIATNGNGLTYGAVHKFKTHRAKKHKAKKKKG